MKLVSIIGDHEITATVSDGTAWITAAPERPVPVSELRLALDNLSAALGSTQ